MSVFVILNHELTDEQKADLAVYGEIVTLTPDQKKVWGQIPPTGDKYDVRKHIESITTEIKNHTAVVCQGEFSAFAEVLDWCQALQKPLLVGCSRRETIEEVLPDGSTKKIAVFRHVQFRKVW